ncbi:MAG: hypothetical protein ACI9R3_002961 [Verrucomicrobiales bacterium]
MSPFRQAIALLFLLPVLASAEEWTLDQARSGQEPGRGRGEASHTACGSTAAGGAIQALISTDSRDRAFLSARHDQGFQEDDWDNSWIAGLSVGLNIWDGGETKAKMNQARAGGSTTPPIVMAAIPFSLVGILPAHGMMGAFFTATSIIGFMAGEIESLMVSRMTVPIVYFRANKKRAHDGTV